MLELLVRFSFIIRNKYFPQMASTGFCLYNNVAVGASYAKANYNEALQLFLLEI